MCGSRSNTNINRKTEKNYRDFMRPGFRPEIVVVEEERRPAPALRGARNKEEREMVRKIGKVLGIVTLAIIASPLLAMAPQAAVPLVRMTHSPLTSVLI